MMFVRAKPERPATAADTATGMRMLWEANNRREQAMLEPLREMHAAITRQLLEAAMLSVNPPVWVGADCGNSVLEVWNVPALQRKMNSELRQLVAAPRRDGPAPSAMVIKGADGKMKTVESPKKIDLEKARRECRDAIQGNTPFHVDPFAAPIPTPEVTEIEECHAWAVGLMNCSCTSCVAERGW